MAKETAVTAEWRGSVIRGPGTEFVQREPGEPCFIHGVSKATSDHDIKAVAHPVYWNALPLCGWHMRRLVGPNFYWQGQKVTAGVMAALCASGLIVQADGCETARAFREEERARAG